MEGDNRVHRLKYREKETDATYIQGGWVPYALPAECLAISSVRSTCNTFNLKQNTIPPRPSRNESDFQQIHEERQGSRQIPLLMIIATRVLRETTK
jgi:hypothetical protein